MTEPEGAVPVPAAPSAPPKPGPGWGGRLRENVETLIVALIAALFIRQYLLEPYKIPTGSMAPGLRGIHRDVTCPTCGTLYETGCRDVEPGGRPSDFSSEVSCPACATRVSLDRYPLRRGDKILANKLVYLLRAPRRWEVVVFHYAREGKTYIKRLAGLPGERLEIRRGDLYINDRLAERPPEVLEAMRVPVYDSASDDPARMGERWRHEAEDVRREDRSFLFVSRDWSDAVFAPEIRDWLPYNDWGQASESKLVPVGDLRVEMTCEVPEGAGIGCEIREDDDVYRWSLGGQAVFEHDVRSRLADRQDLPALAPGRHALVFTNIDDRQTLEVDGVMVFDRRGPAADEAAPASGVRLLGRGGARITRLAVQRDSAYNQDGVGSQGKPVAIPPGRYFFLGDNSLISKDSRRWAYHGGTRYEEACTVPEADIQGRAFLAVGHLDWPWAVPYSELTCAWIR